MLRSLRAVFCMFGDLSSAAQPSRCVLHAGGAPPPWGPYSHVAQSAVSCVGGSPPWSHVARPSRRVLHVGGRRPPGDPYSQAAQSAVFCLGGPPLPNVARSAVFCISGNSKTGSALFDWVVTPLDPVWGYAC
jgi:hypothetical protein